MARANPTWGVVCTAHEPTVLSVTFAAHHLAMGAQHVWLFFDKPNPEAEALLRQMPGVVLSICTDRFWRRVHGGKKPKVVIRRQLANALHVYAGMDVDWLVHMDCDEFLRSDYPLSQVLANVSERRAYLQFAPAERMGIAGQPLRNIFDGVFRRPDPLPKPENPTPDQRMAVRGLTGHCTGKSATRKGEPVLIGIHTPRPLDRSAPYRPMPAENASVTLLHFDGLTPAHWQQKILRAASVPANLEFLRQHDKSRYEQARVLAEADDPQSAATELHDRLKVRTPAEIAALGERGLVDTRPFDPAPALRTFDLAGKLDLSVSSFDAAWRQMQSTQSPGMAAE